MANNINNSGNNDAAAGENGEGSRRKKGPFLIGVAGGTASGKSSVCSKIMERLGQEDRRQVCWISQESFYHQLADADKVKAEKGEYNFDHPNAYDNELFYESLTQLKGGKRAAVPKYDYMTHSRVLDQDDWKDSGDVILTEGILLFYEPKIRDLFDMKVFVDTDSDTRLARRVIRDTKDLGRDLDTVLQQYELLVKPAYEEFCLPTKKYAHITIPRGAENEPAINLMVQHIQEQLRSPRSTPSSDQNGHGIPAQITTSRPH